MTSTIDERVQDFVGQQRWFGGKGRPFTVAAVHRLSWLSPADSWPAVRVEGGEAVNESAVALPAVIVKLAGALLRDR